MIAISAFARTTHRQSSGNRPRLPGVYRVSEAARAPANGAGVRRPPLGKQGFDSATNLSSRGEGRLCGCRGYLAAKS
jgi:hypothetical protein